MFVEIRANTKEVLQNETLPFIIDSIGWFEVQPPIERTEGYRCHHIIWVTEGKGAFTFGGSTSVLSKGQGVFFRSGFPHSYEAADKTFSSFWITFYGLDGLLKHYGIGDAFLFDISDSMSDAFQSLRLHCIGSSSVISRSAAGYSLVLEFLDSCFAPQAPLAKRVEQFLENHFAEALSLDSVAEHIGYNKYTLCKHYQSATGTTVMDTLKKIRIAKSKQYLLSTAYTIENIGKICGFESPSYFVKVFREITGKTPKAYRKSKQ